VIYSNAAPTGWKVTTRLPALLLAGSGGVLAVQMPRVSRVSHTMAEAAAGPAGEGRALLRPRRRVTLPPLRPACVAGGRARIWETEYLQVLDGENPVKEWTKGTWLRPLLAALDEPDRSRFEAAYGALVARAYPPHADGRTLFPFRRLFIIAKAR
jgi:trans-aconitate 2-methyltransferase